MKSKRFKKTKMGVVEYLMSCSYEELQELKKEIVTLLNLNSEKIAERDDTRFILSKHTIFVPVVIDVVKDIEEVLELLNQQEDVHGIITALVQLVKTETLIVGHLKSSSFYKEWVSNGYLNQIETNIKLPY